MGPAGLHTSSRKELTFQGEAEEGMQEHRTAAGGSSDRSGIFGSGDDQGAHKLSLTLFKVFQLMTDKLRKRTLADKHTARLLGYCFLTIDFAQQLGLLLSTANAWPDAAFAWARFFNISTYIIPTQDAAVFNAGFILCALLIVGSMANTAYVARAAWVGQYDLLWPLQSLRTLVALIVTAGLIPITRVLFITLRCDQLAVYLGGDVAGSGCWEVPYLAYALVSLVCLVFLVPFAVATQAVYYDDHPDSGDPVAKPWGRVEAAGAVARMLLPALLVFVDSVPARGIVQVLVFGGMACGVAWKLPYYANSTNTLRVVQYTLVAYLSGCAVVLHSSVATGDAAVHMSVGLLVGSLVPMCLAGVGVAWRRAVLLRLAQGFPAAATGSSGGLPMLQEAGGSSRSVGDEQLSPQVAYLRGVVLDHWLFPDDVEIMARLLLQGISRATPTRQVRSVAQRVDALYCAALSEEVFGSACVPLRLAFAGFLAQHGQDPFRALQVLREASRVPAAPDLSFLVFRKLQDWHHARQRDSVGTDAVDSLAMIQFRKYHADAQRHHHAAVSVLNTLFGQLAGKGAGAAAASVGGGGGSAAHTRSSLHAAVMQTVTAFARERRLATEAYQRALSKFPTSQQLLRHYALFLQHVVNDYPAAVAVRQRVMELAELADETRSIRDESQATPTATDAGSKVSSLGSDSQRSDTLFRLSTQRAAMVQRHELSQAHRIMWWFRLATLAIVILSVGMYVITRSVLGSFAASLFTMDFAGLRRKLTSSSYYYARGLQLAALAGDNATLASLQTGMLKEMQKLSDIHADLYYNGQSFSAIEELYSEPSVRVQELLPGSGQVQNSSLGLWDLGNFLVSNARQVVQIPADHLRAAGSQPAWWFIFANSRTAVLPKFDAAVELYEEYDRTSANNAGIAQAIMLVTVIGITCAVAWWVLRPIVVLVHSSRQSVGQVLHAIPPGAVGTLHKRYKRLDVLYTRLVKQAYAEQSEVKTLQKLQRVLVHNVAAVQGRDRRTSSIEPGPRHVSVEVSGGSKTEPSRFTSIDDADSSATDSEASSDDSEVDAEPQLSPTEQLGIRQRLPPSAHAADLATQQNIGELADTKLVPLGHSHASPHSDTVCLPADSKPMDASLLPSEQTSDSPTLLYEASPLLEDVQTPGEVVSLPSSFKEGERPSVIPTAGSTEIAKSAHAPAQGKGELGAHAAAQGAVMQGQAPISVEIGHAIGSRTRSLTFAEPVHATEGGRSVSPLAPPLFGRPPSGRRLPKYSTQHADSPLSSLGGKKRDAVSTEYSASSQLSSGRSASARKQTTCLSTASKWYARLSGAHNTHVRRLVVTMAFSLVVLGIVYVASFLVTLEIFSRGSFGSAELNNAGKRRYLARETLNAARELMLGDPHVGTVPELANKLERTLHLYRRVHRGLRFGDAGFHLPGSAKRFPAREALMYESTSSVAAGGSRRDVLQSQGVHDTLLHFWLDADAILDRFRDPAVPRLGLNQTRLLGDDVFAELYWLEASVLGGGLEKAVKSYRQEGEATIVELSESSSILFSVNVLVIVGLYFLLHWMAVAQVERQLQRREDVLMVLPQKLLKQSRTLRKFVSHRSTTRPR